MARTHAELEKENAELTLERLSLERELQQVSLAASALREENEKLKKLSAENDTIMAPLQAASEQLANAVTAQEAAEQRAKLLQRDMNEKLRIARSKIHKTMNMPEAEGVRDRLAAIHSDLEPVGNS